LTCFDNIIEIASVAVILRTGSRTAKWLVKRVGESGSRQVKWLVKRAEVERPSGWRS